MTDNHLQIHAVSAARAGQRTQKPLDELRRDAQSVRMFVTDLDGTLLDRKHELPEENRRALTALADRGVILVCATGRARSYIPESVTAINGVKYLISSNGAKLHTNGANEETLFEKYLSGEAVSYVYPLLADKDILSEVFWDGAAHVEQARYNDAARYGIPFWFSDYFFETRTPLENFREQVLTNDHKIENINFIYPNEVIREHVRSMLEARADLFEITRSQPFNYEIGGIGVSKAAALDFIAKREGVSPSEIISFGDNDNDARMIKYAGIGVAVANASPAALSAANYITEDNEHRGVTAALKALVLI